MTELILPELCQIIGHQLALPTAALLLISLRARFPLRFFLIFFALFRFAIPTFLTNGVRFRFEVANRARAHVLIYITAPFEVVRFRLPWVFDLLNRPARSIIVRYRNARAVRNR